MSISGAFDGFQKWRDKARTYIRQGIAPEYACWDEAQGGLFAPEACSGTGKDFPVLIPKEFLTLAKAISCHSEDGRWTLLYTALWRLAQGEKNLLALATDPVVRRLRLMEQSVRRDAHKAKAFVRFRLNHDEDGEHFIAWHRSDHDVLPLVAPFFQRRFEVMRWTILSPLRSVHWNGETLLFSGGVPDTCAPAPDMLEDLWRSYYRATFNPARIKLDMMRREMPVRYWATLPETRIIQDLLSGAEAGVSAMIAHQEDPQRPALQSRRRNAQKFIERQSGKPRQAQDGDNRQAAGRAENTDKG